MATISFDPRRHQRRTFWHGVIVLTALNLALLGAGFALQTKVFTYPHNKPPIDLTGKMQFADLFCLLTIWFTVCVFTKRLRSLGSAPWPQAPSRLLVAWGLISVSLSTLWAKSDMQAFVAIFGLGAGGLLVGLAIDFGLIVWLRRRQGRTSNTRAKRIVTFLIRSCAVNLLI